MTADRKLLKRKQAAEFLGVSYQTIIAAVKTKKLRETRIPSARGFRSMPRYAQRDLDAYVASGYTVGPR